MMGYNLSHIMGGWGFFGLGWLFQVVFWALLIYGVVALISSASKGKTEEIEGSKAMDILKERYVKGEITKKQFDEMKKDLKSS